MDETKPLVSDVVQAAYGRNYSYFSHRIFVAYFPEDLHKYLVDLMYQEEGSPGDATEAIDMQLMRWPLLHRSQLNALSLNRHVEAMRAPDDSIAIPDGGKLRSDIYLRTEITLQFAIELAIEQARQNPMLVERPRLLLALLDAAYYISRTRSEVDHGDGDDLGNDDLLDLSDDTGRKRFEGYLTSRMNIAEDGSGGVGKLLASQKPLTAEETDWLFSVVLAIASALSSRADSAAMQKRWTDVCLARWKYKGLPIPDQTLFQALLVGDESPLERVQAQAGSAGSEAPPKRLFRWRQQKFAGSAQNTPEELANKANPLLKRIARLNKVISEAMFGEQKASVATPKDVTQPLGLLADKYRVLPTSPAWAAIDAAVGRMEQASAGLGDIAELSNDLRMLQGYVRQFSTPDFIAATILSLQLSAVLSGVRAGFSSARNIPDGLFRYSPGSWDESFRLLRDGLELAGLGIEETAKRLAVAVEEVPSRPDDAVDFRSSSDRLLAQPNSLAARLNDWFKLGEAISEDGIVGAFAHADTWKRLATVEAPPLAQVEEPRPSFRELMWYAGGEWPYAELPLRFSQAGAVRWSRVLIDVLLRWRGQRRPPDSADDSQRKLSSGLIVGALRRLGASSLSERALAVLLRPFFQSDASHKFFIDENKVALAPASVPVSDRVAIVVCRDMAEVIEQWPLPPQSCLMLAISPEDLELIPMFDDKALSQNLVEPTRLAIEHSLMTDKRVVDFISKRSVSRLLLFPKGHLGSSEVSLVDPKSADELWTQQVQPQ